MSWITPVFIIKLLLVPLLIFIISKIGQRWGAQVAGLTVGLPVMGGPILFFITLEQPLEFAQAASLTSLANIPANLACGLAFAWAATRLPWYGCILIASCVFVAISHIALQLPHNVYVLSAWTLACLWLAPYCFPNLPATDKAAPAKRVEMALRMLAGATMLLLITYFAHILGADWAGSLSIYPILSMTLSIFLCQRAGPYLVTQLLRGQARSLMSFYLFTLVLWLLLPKGITVAFIAAVVASIMHPALHLLVQRRQSLLS